jgi:predicted regulator of Ras-like GTPase activity (Roadblock/LC7/MglB family)
VTTELTGLVKEIARIRGVRAALLTSESDGLPAVAVSVVGVDEEALAAFAMALLHRSRLANEAAGYGDTRFVALDAEQGRLFVASHAGDVALVVIAGSAANAGMIRMSMQRALARLVASDGELRS